MKDRNLTIALFRSLTILGLGLLLTGCGEELGPVPMKVVQVRGVVREGARRLSGGWVEFFPVNGTVGNLRSARLRGRLLPGGWSERGRELDPIGRYSHRVARRSAALRRLFLANPQSDFGSAWSAS